VRSSKTPVQSLSTASCGLPRVRLQMALVAASACPAKCLRLPAQLLRQGCAGLLLQTTASSCMFALSTRGMDTPWGLASGAPAASQGRFKWFRLLAHRRRLQLALCVREHQRRRAGHPRDRCWPRRRPHRSVPVLGESCPITPPTQQTECDCYPSVHTEVGSVGSMFRDMLMTASACCHTRRNFTRFIHMIHQLNCICTRHITGHLPVCACRLAPLHVDTL